MNYPVSGTFVELFPWVFPKSDLALAGDTMLFFDDGRMYMYYPADQRDGKTGCQPCALLTTEDYCTYVDTGIVIPAERMRQTGIPCRVQAAS